MDHYLKAGLEMTLLFLYNNLHFSPEVMTVDL
jgi:hypothetical protein